MSDRSPTSGNESPRDFGTDKEGKAARWLAEIDKARKEHSDWWDRARAILTRYRDEGPGRRNVGQDVALGMKMNLLWSNVQTLAPAIYASTPDPIVQRRYGDEDDIGRVASTILQRTIRYQLEQADFDQIARECVFDNLIAGRGTVWIRYEPRFGPGAPDIAAVPLPGLAPLPAAAPAPGPAPAPAGLSAPGLPGPAPASPPLASPIPQPANPMAPVLPPTGGPLPSTAPGLPPSAQAPPSQPPIPPSGPPGSPPGGLPVPPVPPPQPVPPPPAPPVPVPAMGLPLGGLPVGDLLSGQPETGRRRPKDGGLQVADDGTHGEPDEVIAYEEVCIDHVNWEDWLTNPARTWAEVRWVARRVYMTRDELAKRFGRRIADEIPLDWHPRDMDETEAMMPANQLFCRAQVYEIWDKPSRKAIWLAHGYGDALLDERDDPLRLPSFFPTPRPLYATLTTESLIPVPDFSQYRDQAAEIDNLTARIHSVGKAIKVCGVYDASQDGIQRMFAEGVENQLIPVNQWTSFAEGGGLKGSIDLLDIGTLAGVLAKLVEIRAQAKQDLYEVTGISDIIRGTTAASETATAQQIKSQFGTMRLRARQGEVARFCRDIIRLVADVICEHFTPRTLLLVSDIAQQSASDAPLALPAIALLKDDKTRPLRIDIETDSTILADQQQEQQSRVAFLQMAGQFLQQAAPAVQQNPAIAPLLGKMMLFGIRAFPAGSELEGAFEQAVKQLDQMAQVPQQAATPPDPKLMLAQAQVQNIQSQIANRSIDNQRDNAEAAAKMRMEAAKLAVHKQRADDEAARNTVSMFHDHAIDRGNQVLEAAKVGLQAGRRPL